MKPEPDFESALDQLEQIADDLERGEPGLAEALAKYEQAVKLLAQCYGRLDDAGRVVALLADVDAEGRPVTAPFDDAATAEPAIEARRSPPASSAKSPQPSDIDLDDPPLPF